MTTKPVVLEPYRPRSGRRRRRQIQDYAEMRIGVEHAIKSLDGDKDIDDPAIT